MLFPATITLRFRSVVGTAQHPGGGAEACAEREGSPANGCAARLGSFHSAVSRGGAGGLQKLIHDDLFADDRNRMASLDTAVVNALVPLGSAALGAGATYAWQALSNRRTDRAVRLQTNARLLELVSFAARIACEGTFEAPEIATLQRIVTSLDDTQVAVAFRNSTQTLWRLGEVRAACDYLISAGLTTPTTRREISTPRLLALTAIDAFTDKRMRNLAVVNASGQYELRIPDEMVREAVHAMPFLQRLALRTFFSRHSQFRD